MIGIKIGFFILTRAGGPFVPPDWWLNFSLDTQSGYLALL